VGGDIVEGRLRNEAGLELADSARVVLFGSPTYMGGPSAQFKAFADASSERWSQRRWVDKLAGGFTIGASLNGDQLSTLV
jgi:multimeric flavodoxin WrbA